MLKYEIYSDVAERPHGHVLTPTKEQSYDIIKSFYAELGPALSRAVSPHWGG